MMFRKTQKSIAFFCGMALITAAFILVGCDQTTNPDNDETSDPLASIQYRDLASITGVTVTTVPSYEEANGPFNAANVLVTIANFNIGKYEVTNDLWFSVYQWATSPDRGANIYTFDNKGTTEGAMHSGAGATIPWLGAPEADKNKPVAYVDWRDSVVWCNAYSEMTGKTPVYKKANGDILRHSDNHDTPAPDGEAENAVQDPVATGYRLPTEAEWEFAARGGNTSAAAWNYRWPGTNTESEVVQYAWIPGDSTDNWAVVGSKLPNSAGIYDMGGNVMEWTSFDTGGYRYAARGGAFYRDDPARVGFDRRDDNGIGSQRDLTGFRVVSK